MTPRHTPKVEAEMIVVEAIRVAHHDVIHGHGRFIDCTASRGYRRDVANALAKKYNDLLDKFELDGMHIEMVKLEDLE